MLYSCLNRLVQIRSEIQKRGVMVVSMRASGRMHRAAVGVKSFLTVKRVMMGEGRVREGVSGGH